MSSVDRLAILLELVIFTTAAVECCFVRRFAVLPSLAAGVLLAAVLLAVRGLPKIGLFTAAISGMLVAVGLLYRAPLRETACALLPAWGWALVLHGLSVQLVRLAGWDGWWILLLQSLLLAASVASFLRRQRAIVPALLHAKLHRQALAQSICLCAAAVAAGLAFAQPGRELAAVGVYATAGAGIVYGGLLLEKLAASMCALREMEEMAYIDHLTGLSNRAGLFLDAQALIAQKETFTLVFIDLDQFKSVNDCFGHLAGDCYLNGFAQAMRGLIGVDGKAYRLSGDEFVCIHTGGGTETFLEGLGCLHSTRCGGEVAFRGCSTGWARFPQDAATLEQLLLIADRKMYRNKQRGLRRF